MDIQALFTLAAMCLKNGRKELALQVLEQACNCEEFSNVLNSSLQPAMQSCSPHVGCNEASGADGDGMDGFNSYVDHIGVLPPTTAIVGGAPSSENTMNPSLHGNDNAALSQILTIASTVYSQKRYLYDGESIIVDPQMSAMASVELENYDDESLVRKPEVHVPLQPGRIKITL